MGKILASCGLISLYHRQSGFGACPARVHMTRSLSDVFLTLTHMKIVVGFDGNNNNFDDNFDDIYITV